MADKSVWPVRPLQDTDTDGIILDWLTAYRTSRWAGCVPNNEYNAVYTAAIGQLWQRGAFVHVCTNPLRPEQTLGWSCTEWTRKSEPVVHFVYVRPAVRRNGIATALLAAAGIDAHSHFAYTYRTDDAAYFPAGMYAPMVARRKTA